MGTAGTEEEISGTMRDTFSKRDTLLGKVTGPVLALVTVLSTFAMFFYFVWRQKSNPAMRGMVGSRVPAFMPRNQALPKCPESRYSPQHDD